MLLTKIRDGESAARPRFRRLSGATLPTMDRRAFLKRSGLAAGAGAFASQLPYQFIGKADAAAVDRRGVSGGREQHDSSDCDKLAHCNPTHP